METLPIGEVARQTGINASAIRYYEAEGLLDSPSRASGWRAFDPDVIDRLRVIKMARDLGFALDDIRTLLKGFSADTPPSQRRQQLARRKLPEVDALIRRATGMKQLLEKGLRCDFVSVQDCILYDRNPPVRIGRRSHQ